MAAETDVFVVLGGAVRAVVVRGVFGEWRSAPTDSGEREKEGTSGLECEEGEC